MNRKIRWWRNAPASVGQPIRFVMKQFRKFWDTHLHVQNLQSSISTGHKMTHQTRIWLKLKIKNMGTFITHICKIWWFFSCKDRLPALSPLAVLQVLDVDQLINVEEVHFAAHLPRAVSARGQRRLLAEFPLRLLKFPGWFVKLEPRGQLANGGRGSGQSINNCSVPVKHCRRMSSLCNRNKKPVLGRVWPVARNEEACVWFGYFLWRRHVAVSFKDLLILEFK